MATLDVRSSFLQILVCSSFHSTETDGNSPHSIRLALRPSYSSSSASIMQPAYTKGFYQRHPVSGHSSTLLTFWTLFCCFLRLQEGAHAKHDVERITLTVFHHPSWLVKSIPILQLSAWAALSWYSSSTNLPSTPSLPFCFDEQMWHVPRPDWLLLSMYISWDITIYSIPGSKSRYHRVCFSPEWIEQRSRDLKSS